MGTVGFTEYAVGHVRAIRKLPGNAEAVPC